MGLVLCIGGCLDGQRVDEQGQYIRWHVPQRMPLTYDDPGSKVNYVDVHEYRLEEVRTAQYTILVYVWVKERGDWIIKLFETYMRHTDRMASVAGRPGPDPRIHHRDDRVDAMRYMMEREINFPPKMPPVDKPVVDKKPTPPPVKIGKVEFSTASSEPKTGKKLAK